MGNVEILDQAASWSLKSLSSPNPPTVPNFLAVIWRDMKDGAIYITRLPGRKLGHFNHDELHYTRIPIPRSHFQPKWHSSFTEYDSSNSYFTNPGPIYIKTPRLVGYDQTAGIVEKVTHEICVLEALRQHPHPNIARYHGCFADAKGESVTGLCMKRYSCTLGALLENRVSPNQQPPFDVTRVLDGILAGINHMHSLGLAHNDITPSNIMLDENGIPVLIDFNNCTSFGQPCRSGTPGWTNFSRVSGAVNDMYGYECVQQYVQRKVHHTAQYWDTNNALLVMN